MGEVLFPSAVVCNMNRLRKSFLNELMADEDISSELSYRQLWRLVEDAFILGRNISEADESDIEHVLNSVTYKRMFAEFLNESMIPTETKSPNEATVHKWNTIMKRNVTAADVESRYRTAFIPEMATQHRDGSMVAYIHFEGSAVFAIQGFSTDLSESCTWFTPYFLPPANPLVIR